MQLPWALPCSSEKVLFDKVPMLPTDATYIVEV